MRFGERVERPHQAVQKFDDLVGRKIVGGSGEADQIGEQNAERLDPVGNAILASRFQAAPRSHRGMTVSIRASERSLLVPQLDL